VIGRGRLHPRECLTQAGVAARRRPIRVAHVATVDLTLRFLLLPQLERLREAGYEVTGISAPGPWVAELEAAGIRHVAWHNATRSWDLRADGRAFAELTRILRGGRFDVVHTHNPKPGVMGRIAARRAGVPVVVNTVHGLYAKPEDRLRRRVPVLALEGLAARFSHLELYQSEEDLAWARRLGVVDRHRSVLLGNGTDLERFRPGAVDRDTVHALRDELGIPRDAVVVGAVGRLVAEKGYRELFEAARRVRAGRPNVRFLVVGSPDEDKSDGIGRDELAAAADDVVFAGWRTDVRDLLAAMDVFVLASWREGLPRSAVEAAAMARPMVLTDIRGCREVARDGVEGLLVPPRDPDALTQAIGRLVDDEALRTRLGAAARIRAVERFDERAVARTIVEHYGRLVERHVPGRTIAETSEAEAEVLDLSVGARIRRARQQDAPHLARLHGEALPDSFLPLLGEGFLRRLYVALATDPEAVAVVAEDAHGVVGFATGALSVRAFYRRFYRRHGIPAAFAAAPRLVRPAIFRRARESSSYGRAERPYPDAELLSIALSPGWRGRGLGRALADQVVASLAALQAREIDVVVSADNLTANAFYRSLGFEQREQLSVHEGRVSNRLVLAVS
jgi:glycosyltransferase involved in cell wall biosynthesis/ribosomal protein S18 acetylase RimI-like enzyme